MMSDTTAEGIMESQIRAQAARIAELEAIVERLREIGLRVCYSGIECKDSLTPIEKELVAFVTGVARAAEVSRREETDNG
jgi:hypothetical protein